MCLSAALGRGGGERAQPVVDEPGGTADVGRYQFVEAGRRGCLFQVLAQAVGLNPPQPEQRPGRDPTGAGGNPEGFAAVRGIKFRFVAKPKPGWNGTVNCEVLEAREPALLRYSWADDAGGDTTEVTYRLEPVGDGTRFTYEHTGFTNVGGLFTTRLLGRVRRKMLTEGLPAVLADLDDEGRLRPESTLRPKS